MKITMQDLPRLRDDLANFKPEDLPRNHNRPLSKRQVVLQLADTLWNLKNRGLTYKDLSTVLEQREIKISPAAIARYLSETIPKKSKPTAKHKPKLASQSREIISPEMVIPIPEMMQPMPDSAPLFASNSEPKKQTPFVHRQRSLDDLV